MARKSSIDRLPKEVRELIGELRQHGRTIDEILAKLRELDVDVSRSALGRHIQQNVDALHERLHESRAVAEAVMGRIEDSSAGQVARINIELMHASLLKLMSSDESAALDGKEAMFLATALQKLASASKVDLDRELKLRAEIRNKVSDRLETAEGEVAKADTPEARAAVLKRIRQDVYGIFD